MGMFRPALAAMAIVLAGSGGGLVLGEYEFTGTTPWLGAVVLGLLTGELAVAVAGRRLVSLALLAAGASAGGLLWGAWISSGEGVAPFPRLAWGAAAVGALVAGWRSWPPAGSSIGRPGR